MDYIKANKQELIYQGLPITLRGVGIGNWLCIEHFMFGLPGSEELIREGFAEEFGRQATDDFFNSYQRHYVTEADFRFLKACGVNFIRVPFNYRLFIDDQTNEYLEEGFVIFDRLLELCRRFEIFLMPDLHTTPGAQNPDWHSDNSYGVPLFWKYRDFRQRVTGLWQKIAERYKDEAYLMGYDLLNEPAMADWGILNEFYSETIAAIRSVDQNHLIVLEGDQFSMDFSGMEDFEDTQIALGFHYYPTVWHPDLLKVERNQRKRQIVEGLERLLDFGRELNRPVLCGEFGYGAPDLGGKAIANELLEDTLEIFQERKLSWTMWCYKDARYMSLVAPKEDNKWMQLIRKVDGKWSQDIEKMQADKLIELLKVNWYPELTEEEAYLLQFRLRSDLYSLEKNHITKPLLKGYSPVKLEELAKQFSFENCEVDEDLKQIICSYLL